MVYGIDWPRQLLINRPQPKNILFVVHNYPSFLFNLNIYVYIMRGENIVAHLDGLGGTPVCRGTPVAHHCFTLTLDVGAFIFNNTNAQ
jgi:hypothetical protein